MTTRDPILAGNAERFQRAERRQEARLAYRRARAELTILERFDDHRAYRYGDYGGGQRAGELSRRRHELERLATRLERYVDVAEPDPTRDELRRAFQRVGLPRYRRLVREAERQQTYLGRGRRTRPTGESIKAWQRLATELELHVDNPTR